jgi:CIC family chloride channel protein
MLPVVAADRRYTGCVSAQDVAEALDDPDPPATVSELVQLPTAIAAGAGPPEILAALIGRGGTGCLSWITKEPR